MSCGLPEMSGVIEMARGRDWRRYQRHRTIRRKAEILRGIGGDENVKAWTAGGTKIGRLSKGKIHCSCWMCRVYKDAVFDTNRKSLLRHISAEKGLK